MDCTVSRLLTLARQELGYHEKTSNAHLDEKTAPNDGAGNYTKYGRDLYKAGYYNGNKNGYSWCDQWVDWLFFTLCGGDPQAAQAMTSQTGPYGASCAWSARYYREGGRFFNTPEPGDQIFFGKAGDEDHTGVVESVTDTAIVTIEGNTENQVARRSYARTDSRIAGFGRPRYDPEAAYTQEQFVREIQAATGAKADGRAGKETISKTCTVSRGMNNKNAALVKPIQRRLIALGYEPGEVDGSYGAKTKAAVMAFQRDYGKNVDGVITKGNITWRKLLGME